MVTYRNFSDLLADITKTEREALTGESLEERIKLVSSGDTLNKILEFTKASKEYSTSEGVNKLQKILGVQYDFKFTLDRENSQILMEIVPKPGSGYTGGAIKPIKIPLMDSLGQFKGAGRNVNTVNLTEFRDNNLTHITDAVGAAFEAMIKNIATNGKMLEGIIKQDEKQLNYLSTSLNKKIREGVSSRKGTSLAARTAQSGDFQLGGIQNWVNKNIRSLQREAIKRGLLQKNVDVKYFQQDVQRYIFAAMEGIKKTKLSNEERKKIIDAELKKVMPYISDIADYDSFLDEMTDISSAHLNYNLVKEEYGTEFKSSIGSYDVLPGGELGRIANRIPIQGASGLIEGINNKKNNKKKKFNPHKATNVIANSANNNTVKLRGMLSVKIKEALKAKARQNAELAVLNARQKQPQISQDEIEKIYNNEVSRTIQEYNEKETEEKYDILRISEEGLNNQELYNKALQIFLDKRGISKKDRKSKTTLYDNTVKEFQTEWNKTRQTLHSGGVLVSDDLLSDVTSPYDFNVDIGLSSIRYSAFKEIRKEIIKQLRKKFRKVDSKNFTKLNKQLKKFKSVDEFLNASVDFDGTTGTLTSFLDSSTLTALLNNVPSLMKKEAEKRLAKTLGTDIISVDFKDINGQPIDWLKGLGGRASGQATVNSSSAKLLVGEGIKVNPSSIDKTALSAIGEATGNSNIQAIASDSNKNSARKNWEFFNNQIQSWVIAKQQSILSSIPQALSEGATLQRKTAMEQGLLELFNFFDKYNLGFLKKYIVYDDDIYTYLWKEDPIKLIEKQFANSEDTYASGNAVANYAKALDSWAHGEGKEMLSWSTNDGIVEGAQKSGNWVVTSGTIKLANEPDYSGFGYKGGKNLKISDLFVETLERDIGPNNLLVQSLKEKQEKARQNLRKKQLDFKDRIDSSQATKSRQEELDELNNQGAIILSLDELSQMFADFDFDEAYDPQSGKLKEDAYNQLMGPLQKYIQDIATTRGITEEEAWKNLYLDFGEKGASVISDYGDKKYKYESFFFKLDQLNKHNIAQNITGESVIEDLPNSLMTLVKQSRKYFGSKHEQRDINDFLENYIRDIYNDLYASGENDNETTYDKNTNVKLKDSGYFKAVAYENPNDLTSMILNPEDVQDWVRKLGKGKKGIKYYETLMKHYDKDWDADTFKMNNSLKGTTDYKEAMFNSIMENIGLHGISAMLLRYPIFSGRNVNFGKIYLDKDNVIARNTMGVGEALLAYLNGDVDGDRLLAAMLSGVADSPEKFAEILKIADAANLDFKPILARIDSALKAEAKRKKTGDTTLISGKTLSDATKATLNRASAYYSNLSKPYTPHFSNLNTSWRNITHAVGTDESTILNAQAAGTDVSDEVKDKVLHSLSTRVLTNLTEQLPISSKKIIEHLYEIGELKENASEEEAKAAYEDVVGTIKTDLGNVNWDDKESIRSFFQNNLVKYGFLQDGNKRFLSDVATYQMFIGNLESVGLLERLAKFKGMDVNSDEFKALIDPTSEQGLTLDDFINLIYANNKDLTGVTIADARDPSKAHVLKGLNSIFNAADVATTYNYTNKASRINETNMAYKIGVELKAMTDVVSDAGKELAAAAGVATEGLTDLNSVLAQFITALTTVNKGATNIGIGNFTSPLSNETLKDMIKYAADTAATTAFADARRDPNTYKSTSKLAHNLFPTGIIYEENTAKKEFEKAIIDGQKNQDSISKDDLGKIKSWMNPNNLANSADFGSYIHDIFGAMRLAKDYGITISSLADIYDMLEIDNKDLQKELTASREGHPEESIKQSLLNLRKVQLAMAKITKKKGQKDPTSTAFLDKGYILGKGLYDLFTNRTKGFEDFQFYGVEQPIIWNDIRHPGTPRQGYMDYLYSHVADDGYGSKKTYLTVGDIKSISGRNGAPGGADIAQVLEYTIGLRVLQQFLQDNPDLDTAEKFTKSEWGAKFPRLTGEPISDKLLQTLRNKNTVINGEFATYDRYSQQTKIFSMAQGQLTDKLLANFNKVIEYAEDNPGIGFESAANAIFGSPTAGQDFLNQIKSVFVSSTGETYADYENKHKQTGVLSKYKKLATEAAKNKLKRDALQQELDNAPGLDDKTRASKEEELKQLKIIYNQSRAEFNQFKKENDSVVNAQTGSMNKEVRRVNRTIKAANSLEELEAQQKQAEEKLAQYLKLKKEVYEIKKRQLDRKIINKEFLTPEEQELYAIAEENDAENLKAVEKSLKSFNENKDFITDNAETIAQNNVELATKEKQDKIQRIDAVAQQQKQLLENIRSSYLNEARLSSQIGNRKIQSQHASPEMRAELEAQNAIDQAEIEKIKKEREKNNWEAQITDSEKLQEVYKDVALQTDNLVAAQVRLNKEMNPTVWDTMKKSFQGWIKSLTSGSLIWTFAAQARRSINNIVQGAQKLDVVLTDLRIVTGDTREETKSLMTSYSKLGKELSASTSEVASAANSWLRQGYAISEVNDLISASMHLSKLGMIDSGKATEYLTSMLKGFKLEAVDAMSIVDKLTKVDMVAATSAGDIAESLRQFATTAQLSGVDLDQAIAMATTIMDVSQAGASTVGVALKSMLSRFGNVKAGAFTGLDLDSETGEVGSESLNDLEKVLKKLGISMRDTNLQFRDFDDVLEDISAQWSLYDNVTKNAIATAAAGTRQREAFLVLMENMDKYHSLLETSQNAEGTAEEKYLSYQDSLQAAQKRLSAAWEELALNNDVSRFMTGVTNFTAFLVKHLPFIVKWVTRMVNIASATRVPTWINKLWNISGMNYFLKEGAEAATSVGGFVKRKFKRKPTDLVLETRKSKSLTGLDQAMLKIQEENKTNPNSFKNVFNDKNVNANTTSTITVKSGIEGLILALRQNTDAVNRNTTAAGGEIDEVSTEPLEQTKGQKFGNTMKKIGAMGSAFAFGALMGGISADTQHTNASGEMVENSKEAQTVSTVGNALIGGTSAALQMGGPFAKIAGLILQMVGPLAMQVITKWIDAERDARADRVEAANNIVKAINSLENVTSNISEKIDDMADSMSNAEWIEKIQSVEDSLNSKENKKAKEAIWKELSANDKYSNIANISEFFDIMSSASKEEREAMWHDYMAAQNKVKYESEVKSKEDELYDLAKKDKKSYTFSTPLSLAFSGKYHASSDEFIYGSEQGKKFGKWLDKNESKLQYSYSDGKNKQRTNIFGFEEGTSTKERISILKELQQVFEKGSEEWNLLQDAIRELTKVEQQRSKDAAAIYKESNKQLAQNAINEATYQGQRLLDLNDYDLSNLSKEQIEERIKASIQALGGFMGIAPDSEEAQRLIDQAITSNTRLYEAVQGKTKTLNQVIENNDIEVQKKFASALGVTREQLLQLKDTLGELTLGDLIGGLENLRTKIGDVTSTLQKIASSGGLSNEEVETLLSKYPELTRFTGDVAAMTTQLLKKGGAYSAAYQRGMMQELMGSTSLFNALRKELHNTKTNNTNLEDLLFSGLNKPEGATALFNGAKSLGDVFSRMSSAAQLTDEELMAKYGLSKEELKRVQDIINEYYQVTIKDPIKEAQFDMFSSHLQKVYEKQIKNLEEQKSALQEITSQREYENKLIEAKIKLENAQHEKKRVWREGVGWSYESDQSAIAEAQKNLDSVNIEYKVADLEAQITQLQAEKDELSNIKDNDEFDRMSEAFESFKKELGDTFESQLDIQKAIKKLYDEVTVKVTGPSEEDANAITAEKTSDLDTAAADLVAKKQIMDNIKNDPKKGVHSKEYYYAEKDYNESLKNFNNTYKNFSENNSEVADIWKNTTSAEGTKNSDLLDYEKSESFTPQMEFNGQVYDVKGKVDKEENKEGDKVVDTKNTNSNDDMMKYYAYEGMKNGVPQYAKAQTISDAQANAEGAGTIGLMGYLKKRGAQTGTVVEQKKSHNKLVFINGAVEGFPEAESLQPGFYQMKKSSDVEKAATGSLGLSGGPTLVNELGTEAIISPWGTITSLPSATGVVPADVTKNLWQLGELAPSILKLLAQSSALNNLPFTALNNAAADNSLNISNLTMNVSADESFNIDSFTQELRNVMNLTRRERH